MKIKLNQAFKIVNIKCKLSAEDDLKTYNHKLTTITNIINKTKPGF